jgi:hypothetical protein
MDRSSRKKTTVDPWRVCRPSVREEVGLGQSGTMTSFPLDPRNKLEGRTLLVEEHEVGPREDEDEEELVLDQIQHRDTVSAHEIYGDEGEEKREVQAVVVALVEVVEGKQHIHLKEIRTAEDRSVRTAVVVEVEVEDKVDSNRLQHHTVGPSSLARCLLPRWRSLVQPTRLRSCLKALVSLNPCRHRLRVMSTLCTCLLCSNNNTYSNIRRL